MNKLLATILGSLLFCCLVSVSDCFAATLIVTTAADTADGNCDIDCSLREAVIAANSGDTIAFSPLFNSPQTITLTLGQIPITSSVTIAGPGSNLLSISGNNAGRIFKISGGAVVSMSGMKLTNGRASGNNDYNGGAILLSGSMLTLTNMVLSNNSARYTPPTGSPQPVPVGFGGAILNSNGTLSIINSTIESNSVPGSPGIGEGGGIYLAGGILNVTNSTIRNNARQGVSGSSNALTIVDSTFTGNSSTAIVSSSTGRTSIFRTIVRNNGGGVFSQQAESLSIDSSIISDNGSGIYAQGTTAITKTVINNNPGGVRNSGTMTINDSTISNCVTGSSGGGLYNTGWLNLINSTVSGNSAPNGGGGTNGFGGGIYNTFGGNLILTNSTIANNYAARTGGGLTNDSSGTVTIRNSIFSGNTVSFSPMDIFGAIISQGHNLISTASYSSGWIASDLLNQNPLLAPLGNNGGPTQTHALSPYSAAINGGSNALAIDPATNRELSRDQRGFSRQALCIPSLCTVDIGAFEAQEPATLSGRVLTSDGRAVSNARITVTDAGGTSVYSQTSSLGYYNFPNLSVGATYTVTVAHKSYQFGSPQVLSIVSTNNGLNFVAFP